MPISFDVAARDRQSAARTGRLTTAHGVVETPAFFPVATQGAVKGLDARDLLGLDVPGLLANAYHLYLRPGTDLVAEAGGLHAFMGWPRPLITDSGGFQVMSLSRFCRIEDEGVTFRSHLDGSLHHLTPEGVVAIQERLGSDIAMPLDVCPPYPADYAEVERAVRLTQAWAERSLQAKKRRDQATFAIVQGGVHDDLRERSARGLAALDLPGYAVGGLSVGEPLGLMNQALEAAVPHLPEERPRYLMGVGTPDLLLEAVWRGCDIFDCVLPTRMARTGTILTWAGRLPIRNATYARDLRPLEEGCACPACRHHTRAYVRHLIKAGEMLGLRLCTLHNLHFILSFMSEIRRAIAENRLARFREQFWAKNARY